MIHRITMTGTIRESREETAKSGRRMAKYVIEERDTATDGEEFVRAWPMTRFLKDANEHALPTGWVVNASARITSREWNGKIYLDLMVEKIETVAGQTGGGAPAFPAAPQAGGGDSEMPF